jgi:Flp pilus assembly protein TadD
MMKGLAAFVALGVVAGASDLHAEERPVTFSRDIAPIILHNCTSCHRPGEAAPFSLLNYDDVRQRARQIATITDQGFMPPWKPDPDFRHFEGERRLEPAEVDLIRQWVEADTPEGDPRDLPPMPPFADGWQLGKPDLVIAMPEAYTVPAEGGDLFRNFVLPFPSNERRYVQAIEFRPGNARVVHHARILLDESGELRRRDADDPGPGFDGMEAPGAHFPDGHFLGWAPGKMARREAVAWPLEMRSDFIVQVHLKPTGRPETLRASIGLYFTNRAPASQPVLLRLGSRTIDIPAGEREYVVSDSYTLPVDVQALSIYPHAHYLAREMTVVAEMPGGGTERLLRIANWDFNWQDEYEYEEPVDLPKGARLVMRYVYDNSAENPRNPSSPPRRVLSGPGSADEMGELLVQLMPAREADAAPLRAEVARKSLLAEVAGEEKRVADVPDDFQVRNALGVHYVQLGRRDEAREQFLASIAIAPGHAVAHYNLAVIAMMAGRADEAFTHFDRALRARPDYPEALTNLGALLEASGRIDEALEHYRKALAARPDHAAAHANLARVLMRQGRPDEAIRHYERLQRQQPDNPVILDSLAAAYFAAGRPDQAARVAHAALQRAQAAHNEALARDIRGRLQQYEAAEDAAAAVSVP